jgi:hypothetical protein
LLGYKVQPRIDLEGPEGEYSYSSTLSLTSAPEGGGWSTTRPLYPRESPGTQCTGGWVGTRAGLDVCGKSRPPPGLDLRTVQPVASSSLGYSSGRDTRIALAT